MEGLLQVGSISFLIYLHGFAGIVGLWRCSVVFHRLGSWRFYIIYTDLIDSIDYKVDKIYKIDSARIGREFFFIKYEITTGETKMI